ncbi:MAG TPA: sterol-binding protein [Burkholderiales bacterium]
MIERGAVAALNHLLQQQAWAAERLSAFAGQGVEFRCPPFPDLRLRITDNGLIDQARGEAASALVVKLTPGTLPFLLARDEAARTQVEIEGSADLASTVDYLFRHLSWDFEEDLSKLFGDVVAHRLASGGRAFAAWQREAALRLAENLVEYWTEEQPLLARPPDVERFCRDVDALRDDVARIEKRIERLSGSSWNR